MRVMVTNKKKLQTRTRLGTRMKEKDENKGDNDKKDKGGKQHTLSLSPDPTLGSGTKGFQEVLCTMEQKQSQHGAWSTGSIA